MSKQTFDNLLALARMESAPCVDVSDGVLLTLSEIGPATGVNRAYFWVGVASAAAAACIALVATLSSRTSADSVSELITFVAWVAQ